MGKKLLVTADMHTASTVAVFPECAYKLDYEPQNEKTLKMDFIEDKAIKPNKVSRFLYKKYQEMCDDVGKVDMHIHLAETCEGVNPKAHGKETYTTDLLTQVSTAVYLETMIKAKRREIMQGSFYHVGENLSTDELVAKLLGAGHHTDLKLTVDKLSCYFRHPIGSTRGPWMYKPTKVAREMMLGELNKDEYGKFNIYGFGHVHSFVGVEYGSSYGFTCPGWKGRDNYAKRGSLSWLPQCGYMLFEIEGSNFERFKHTFVMKGRQIIDEVKI
jgi:hypothetical protein